MTSIHRGMTVDEALQRLREKARPGALEGMSKYGMSIDSRLGVSMPEIRKLAGEIGKAHGLAMGLWKSGIAEARILATMVADPRMLTGDEMELWVKDFDSWDICDEVCMNLFDKSPFAREKVFEWAGREEEFVKRAAFSLIACLAWHDKSAGDAAFLEFLPVIARAATDERNFVKKAVNWALRHIGKRNLRLNAAAIEAARRIG